MAAITSIGGQAPSLDNYPMNMLYTNMFKELLNPDDDAESPISINFQASQMAESLAPIKVKS